MGLNKSFSGLAPVALPVLYCPPHTPDDVIPALTADSYPGGKVSLNTFPCAKNSGSEYKHGIPHVSDPGLFDDKGHPTALARNGWWLFPKWYDDLIPESTVRPVADPQVSKKSNKDKGNA